MGTKLNEGISWRLGATWSRPRRLVCVLLSLLAPLVVLVAPEAAQALTLPAMPTAGSLSSSAAGAAAVAGDAASMVQSATTAAAGAAAPSAAAPSAGAASGGGSAAGAAPIQHQITAAVQSVRTAVSRAVSAASASRDPAPAPPVPTVVTDPPAVPTPSSVQQSATAALQRAGVSAGAGGSDPVPVTVSPGSVAGTGGLQLDPQILAAVGDLATRLGTSARTLLTAASARSGVTALTGPGGRPAGARDRRSPSSGGTPSLAGSDAAAAWRLPRLVSGLESGGSWSGARRAVAGSARRSALARNVGPRRSRPPAADPATPAPLLFAPAPGAPATAGGAGVGTGAAAVMLFIIAAIWLLRTVSDRMSLEALAWREPLLALRLERPG